MRSFRIPDLRDLSKTKKTLDQVQTNWTKLGHREGTPETDLAPKRTQTVPPNQLETELHFLTSCQFQDIRNTDFPWITQTCNESPDVNNLLNLLGEIRQCMIAAARFVTWCDERCNSNSPDTDSSYWTLTTIFYLQCKHLFRMPLKLF